MTSAAIPSVESGLNAAPRAALAGRIAKLEALRGAAAAYVLCHHLGNYFDVARSRYFLPFAFGQEAVILFFLLSGFVIQMTTDQAGRLPFRDYFIKRARRIYPIFLIALALGYASVAWRTGSWVPVDAGVLAGNLLMLQDFEGVKPGAWFGQYMLNRPLWSLSYEWWFYLLFFPIYRLVAPDRRRAVAFGVSLVAIIGYAVQPNGASLFAGYFAIWWAGADMAREYGETGTVSLRRQWPAVIGLLLLAGIWSVLTFKLRGMAYTSPGATPVLQVRHYGTAAILIVLGILWRSRFAWRGFNFTLGPFAVIAPVSYALYLVHWPIVCEANLFAGTLHEPIRLLVLLALTFVVAYLLEVRLQRWINRMTNPLLRTRAKTKSAGDMQGLQGEPV